MELVHIPKVNGQSTYTAAFNMRFAGAATVGPLPVDGREAFVWIVFLTLLAGGVGWLPRRFSTSTCTSRRWPVSPDTRAIHLSMPDQTVGATLWGASENHTTIRNERCD